MMVIKDCST